MKSVRNTCNRALTIFGFIFSSFIATDMSFAAVEHTASWSTGCTMDGVQEMATDSSSSGRSVISIGSTASTFSGCTTVGTATAGDGVLVVDAESDTNAGFEARSYGGAASVESTSRYTEIKVTPEAGQSDGIIDMALAFDFNAMAAGNTQTGESLDGAFKSFVKLQVVVSGGINGPDNLVAEFEAATTQGAECPLLGCSNGGFSTLITDVFSFDTTNSLVISLNLFGSIDSSAFFGGLASSNVLGRASFRTVDAFILPDGYTVNYPEANIVDGNWVAPVPLPAALPLFMAGFLVIRIVGQIASKGIRFRT